MTAAQTTRPQTTGEPRRKEGMRPLERRLIQAVVLVCAVPGFLVLQWTDERKNVEGNLKPPEKVTTVPAGKIGEFAGAHWKLIGRKAGRPLTSAEGGDVAELQLSVAVRPETAASAKTVGSYGLTYQLFDDSGREWSALGTRRWEPRAGVPMLITVRGTVPRAKADSVELQIQQPKAERKKGAPLASLRFAR